ncbi:MAG TPA: hypothetical protein VGS78_01340 [Candidatus Sulfotelmatobacter sp.]|nr:hypothetical protein [Candidatus Sulfotelmatobacter sp.]
MKSRWGVALAALAVMGISCVVVAQENDEYDSRRGFPPESRIESSQGQPNKSGIVSHKYVTKGTRMKCIQVEHNPKHADDSAACVAKFKGYASYTLKFGEVMRAPKDSEVYLECAGEKPTHCTIGVW